MQKESLRFLLAASANGIGKTKFPPRGTLTADGGMNIEGLKILLFVQGH